jgi:hypothetical protein
MKMGKMHPEWSKARKISGLESLIIKLYIIYIMRHNFWCGNCIVLLTDDIHPPFLATGE